MIADATVFALALGLSVLSVCGAVLSGRVRPPEIVAVEHSLVSVDREATVVESEVVVTNPNSFTLPLERLAVEYTIESNGIVLGEGREPGRRLPPGDTTVEVRTRIDNDRIPAWWTSHVQREESTRLTVDAAVVSGVPGLSYGWRLTDREVETDIVTAFEQDGRVPVGVDAAPVSGPLLYVTDSRIAWGSATDGQTTVQLRLDVYNPLPSPVPVESLSYEVRMNEVTVATGDSESLLPIPPDSTQTVPAEITIDNRKLAEWWVTHANRDQRTVLTVDYDVRMGFTQFLIGLRFSPGTIDRTVETSIFEPGADSLEVSVR